MKVTLLQSVTTSLRVGFTQHARDLDDPRDAPVTLSLPKADWVALGSPTEIVVEVTGPPSDPADIPWAKMGDCCATCIITPGYVFEHRVLGRDCCCIHVLERSEASS